MEVYSWSACVSVETESWSGIVLLYSTVDTERPGQMSVFCEIPSTRQETTRAWPHVPGQPSNPWSDPELQTRILPAQTLPPTFGLKGLCFPFPPWVDSRFQSAKTTRKN